MTEDPAFTLSPPVGAPAFASDYTGVCEGGPYHGRTVVSGLPKGFALVGASLTDAPDSGVWIYDYDGVTFECRDPGRVTAEDLQRLGPAEGYDVVRYRSAGSDAS